MASGKSIGKVENQKAQELHKPSSHNGTPIQGRVHAPAPQGK